MFAVSIEGTQRGYLVTLLEDNKPRVEVSVHTEAGYTDINNKITRSYNKAKRIEQSLLTLAELAPDILRTSNAWLTDSELKPVEA